jgi:transposase-like protein
METVVFEQFCAEAKHLTVGQMRQLRGLLLAMDARIDLLSRIDERRAAITECPYCHKTRLRRWGETRTGLQRLRCLSCLKTFSTATNTAVERIRHPVEFYRVVEDMFSHHPRTCRQLAEDLGLNKMTVWRWRHRILRAILEVGSACLSGIVEADEKFFRESRKGSREWVNHQRNPAAYAAPPRLRWRDYRKLNIRNHMPSSWQIPVLTIIDRSGNRRGDVLPGRAAGPLIALLQKHVAPDAVLCTDGDTAYQAFARQLGIPHYVLNAKTGPRVIDNVFHIQTTNSLHDRFKRFIGNFRGPATKFLPAYTAWFIAQQMGQPKERKDSAWRHILAA